MPNMRFNNALNTFPRGDNINNNLGRKQNVVTKMAAFVRTVKSTAGKGNAILLKVNTILANENYVEKVDAEEHLPTETPGLNI